MKSSNPWKLIIFAMLVAILTTAPLAIADDIDPDADIPDISTMTDTTPVNPVLEIPQQCDQDSVAVLCDRSADDSSPSADVDAAAPMPTPTTPAMSPAIRRTSVRFTTTPTRTLPTRLPRWAPSACRSESRCRDIRCCRPGPVVVSSAPLMGPGSYQQWTGGPGAYQQWAGGPGSYRSLVPGSWVHRTDAVRISSIRRSGAVSGHAFVRSGGHFGR